MNLAKHTSILALVSIVAAACGTSSDGARSNGGKGGSGTAGQAGSGGNRAGNSGGAGSGGAGSGGAGSGGAGSGGAGSGGAGSGGAGSGGAGSGGAGAGGTPPVATAGLVGHWKFDEGAGSMAKDSSPNGNHGTIVKGTAATENAAATWGDGHAGKALQFNGSDDWVRVPDSDSIDSTGVNGTWSIAAWVNISRNADPVLDKFNFFASRHEDQTAYDHLGLGVRNTFLTGAVHFTFATGTTPFPLDKWTHVAATYDALTLVIYQDGVQAGEIAVGYPIGTDSTFFAIGGDWNVDTMKEFTQGYLDDVYLYNTALTADQVAALAK